MEGERYTSTEAKRPNVVHCGDYDVITPAGKDIEIDGLLEVLNKIDERPVIDLWGEDENRREITFYLNGEKYFLKQKWFEPNIQRSVYGKMPLDDQTLGSILNEMKLSPMVSEILKEVDVTSLIKKFGFDSIELVEAVAGVVRRRNNTEQIDRKPGDLAQKFMVYEGKELEYKELDELAKELADIFRKKGIEPIDMQHNIFVDAYDPKKLHLIDIEAYATLGKAKKLEGSLENRANS